MSTIGADERVYFRRQILHMLSRTRPQLSRLGRWLPLLLFTARIRFILTRTIPCQEETFPLLRGEEYGKDRNQRDHDTETATCPPNTFSFYGVSIHQLYLHTFFIFKLTSCATSFNMHMLFLSPKYMTWQSGSVVSVSELVYRCQIFYSLN